MTKDFQQIVWDERLRADWRQLLRLAVEEDLGEAGDWTTRALVPEHTIGRAAVVARESGVVAGLPAVEMTLEYFDPRLQWAALSEDGQSAAAGEHLGLVEGPAAGLLTAERILLNALGRLCGIATLTRRYVEAVAGSGARVYDTRKTTPGWRRLEKYAVRCGGGHNHRTGLFEAILIKDNHLALHGEAQESADTSSPAKARFTPADAVEQARRFVAVHVPEPARERMIVEVEVDSIEQLGAVLPVEPDLVLLDNMNAAQLSQAVALRNAAGGQVALEASGGVTLETIGPIAATGVDRISVGALTHSAVSLDVSLDWISRG